MDITPSIAGVLQPSDLGGIQTIVSAGETLPSHIASQWAPYARVLNIYGPAECTAKATMAAFERHSATSSASCIGRGLGLERNLSAGFGRSENTLIKMISKIS